MLRTKVRCGESQENHVWSKWKYQQGDSPKRREKKKLEMKSTITDVKNSLEEFKGRFEQAEKKIQRTWK